MEIKIKQQKNEISINPVQNRTDGEFSFAYLVEHK